jgi:ABC-type sugar transport system substrate-binding protein
MAYEKATEALKAYPDLKGIICMSSATGPGVCQAVAEAGKTEDIAVITMTTPNAIADYLKDGSSDLNIIWDPAYMVYANCYLARMYFDGENVADGTNIAEAAKDGSGKYATTINALEVDATGLHMTLGAPLFMNKDNVADWDF